MLTEATKLGTNIEYLSLYYNSNKEYKHYDLNLIGIMSKNKIEWYFFIILNPWFFLLISNLSNFKYLIIYKS